MGIFSSGADSARKVRKLLAAQAAENKQLIGDAGTFAEQQLSPYMMDPSVMAELNAVATGQGGWQDNPIFQNYMQVGKEAMMADLANTGTLYSGKRMEEVGKLGQNAFTNYMNTLTGLAGFGREGAAQMGGIRMGTAQNLAGIGQNAAENIANVRMAQSANERGLGLGVLQLGGEIFKKMATGGADPSSAAAASGG